MLYVTLTASGIKPEGEPYTRWFCTEVEAMRAFNHSLKQYAGDAQVEWRTRPEIEKHQGRYQVYARLRVTQG